MRTSDGTCVLRNVLVIALVLNLHQGWAQVKERDAYDALKGEEMIGVKVSPHCYVLLDSIFREATERIDFSDVKSDSGVLAVCQAFSKMLREEFGFRYRPVGTLARGLEKRGLDCNYNSLLFYTLLNKIKGYKVFPIVVPGHMFIRWYLSDTLWINYETTTEEAAPDEEYRDGFRISPQAEAGCLYLCPLTDQQMTAVHLAEVANDMMDTNIRLAISLNLNALHWDTSSFHLYRNLSLSYYLSEKEDSSDYYFAIAMALDSLNYTVYQGRGEMYLEGNEPAKSLEWFDRAININPGDPTLPMLKCYARVMLKDAEGAIKEFEKANQLIDKENFLTFLVNYSFLAWLDQQIVMLVRE